MVVRHEIKALRFDEKSFFNTILGLSPYWDYKSCNEYFGEKILNLKTIDKIHLKSDVIDGSVVNGLRLPILYSFDLNKPHCYKIFCEPETIHYKKVNKSVLNTRTFYLEDKNNEKVDFNHETMTSTLQLITI